MVRPMYRVIHVHPSGYYKWLVTPESSRAQENKALTALIIEYWEGSDKTYGSPRIHRDLRESGEHCGENRIARLMRKASIKAVRAYRKPSLHQLKAVNRGSQSPGQAVCRYQA